MTRMVCVLVAVLVGQAQGWTIAQGRGDGTSPTWISIPAASCLNATATSNWDLPTANAPTAACLGTTVRKGVLEFDATTNESIQTHLALAPEWVEGGGLVVALKYQMASAITGTVIWCAQVACAANNETDDPAFDTADCVTDTVLDTAAKVNDASLTLSATELDQCAAGELLHLKVYRDAATDSASGDAHLVMVRLEVTTSE